MILIINDDITHKTLEDLANAYNQLDEKQISILQIFLTSNGGETHVGEAMAEIINRNASRTLLTIHSFIESAAFDLFFSVNCARLILPTAIGTAHISRWAVVTGEGGIMMDDREAFKVKSLKTTLKTRLDLFKSIGMTDDELERIKNGDDLYFDAKRLNTMLTKSIKNEIRRSNS